MAWPLTAAITSLRTCQGVVETAAALKVPSSRLAKVSPPAERSAPEQKAGGAPVRTTARTASSASQRPKASPSSWPMPPPNALRTSGRLRVIEAHAVGDLEAGWSGRSWRGRLDGSDELAEQRRRSARTLGKYAQMRLTSAPKRSTICAAHCSGVPKTAMVDTMSSVTSAVMAAHSPRLDSVLSSGCSSAQPSTSRTGRYAGVDP